MEKIKVTVTGVRVFDENVDVPSVEIQIAQSIQGYSAIKKGDLIVGYELGDVTKFPMSRSQLTRELRESSDLFDLYCGCHGKPLEQKHFALILRGAELTIVRTAHAAGEVRVDKDNKPIKDEDGNDKVYSRDCFSTNVVGVTLTPKAEARIDAACTLD